MKRNIERFGECDLTPNLLRVPGRHAYRKVNHEQPPTHRRRNPLGHSRRRGTSPPSSATPAAPSSPSTTPSANSPSTTSSSATSRARPTWPTATPEPPAGSASAWPPPAPAPPTSSPASPPPCSIPSPSSPSPVRSPPKFSVPTPSRKSTSPASPSPSPSTISSSPAPKTSPPPSGSPLKSPAPAAPVPVLVDITKDAQQATAPFNFAAAAPRPTRAHPMQSPLTPAALASAAELIRASLRPVILAGHGIVESGAEREVLAFAESLQIPIASTLLGLGCIPAGHPLSLGMMGMHGESWVNEAIQNADLLLAFGMRFDDRVTGNLAQLRPQRQKDPHRNRPQRNQQKRPRRRRPHWRPQTSPSPAEPCHGSGCPRSRL